MFTKILSEFIANADFDDLPESAIAAARRGVLDYLGVTAGGASETIADILKQYAEEMGAVRDCTVINGGKTSVTMAAYVNGALSHALDYDDVIHVNPLWMGHPSVAILPAIFSVAERENRSGQDLILAYSVGIEIYTKVGLLCGDTAYKNGWHNTSYIGTMAAAGAVARLLGLDAMAVGQAFGIAGSMASGLRQNFGTMVKPLHAGIAARNGVEAAYLARRGITSAANIFEAPLGFRNVFSCDHADLMHEIPYGEELISPEEFSTRLGRPWNISSPGMSYKICPSCRATHFGMEAALLYREQHPVDLDSILEIDCRVPSHMESVLFYHDPVKGLEGKFSLEYVFARTLIDGPPKINDFSDSRVNEVDVKSLIRKIRWNSFDPEPGTFGTPEYVIRHKDGTTFEAKVEYPRGEPENSVSDQILIEKFKDCSGAIWSQKRREQVLERVLVLEHVEDITLLTRLFGQ